MKLLTGLKKKKKLTLCVNYNKNFFLIKTSEPSRTSVSLSLEWRRWYLLQSAAVKMKWNNAWEAFNPVPDMRSLFLLEESLAAFLWVGKISGS